jgi:hypothetical protein
VFGHQVIGRMDRVLDSDEIRFTGVSGDFLEAVILEKQRILELKPKYNTYPVGSNVGKKCIQIECPCCRKMFLQNRNFQKYCSKSCRNGLLTKALIPSLNGLSEKPE